MASRIGSPSPLSAAHRGPIALILRTSFVTWGTPRSAIARSSADSTNLSIVCCFKAGIASNPSWSASKRYCIRSAQDLARMKASWPPRWSENSNGLLEAFGYTPSPGLRVPDDLALPSIELLTTLGLHRRASPQGRPEVLEPGGPDSVPPPPLVFQVPKELCQGLIISHVQLRELRGSRGITFLILAAYAPTPILLLGQRGLQPWEARRRGLRPAPVSALFSGCCAPLPSISSFFLCTVNSMISLSGVKSSLVPTPPPRAEN